MCRVSGNVQLVVLRGVGQQESSVTGVGIREML